MARGKAHAEDFSIHEDAKDSNSSHGEEEEEDDDDPGRIEESRDVESADCQGDHLDASMARELDEFDHTFKGLEKRFRLVNRIGEGTFSTVYKAEDLLYDAYHNDWDIEQKENLARAARPTKKRRTNDSVEADAEPMKSRSPRYVAIKKIYVTSSPTRIQNELELLHDLQACQSVCPLITAFRHQDQVIAVLPYFHHTEFRDYFRDLSIDDMRIYFRSLFEALAAVHDHDILHRDIKPTNFLYNIEQQRGVLVDFGLAEREGTDSSHCVCEDSDHTRDVHRSLHPQNVQKGSSAGYVKNDSRPSRRANRAGTRGFRAPEVLLKCTAQTTKIDVWSVGVIMLTILAQRFPFFNSLDDIDALIEIATIFGTRRMRSCAMLHGSVFESTIPTIGEKGFSFEKIILWSTGRSRKGATPESEKLSEGELAAIGLLEECMDLDPRARISAQEALQHPFLAKARHAGPPMQFEDADDVDLL